MKYTNKEKRAAAREEKLQHDMTRFKLYEESESFDEYLLNATMHGVAKKHKFLDVFWWYYHFKDTPVMTTFSLIGSFFGVCILLAFAIRMLSTSIPFDFSRNAVFLACFASTVFGCAMTVLVCLTVFKTIDDIDTKVTLKHINEKHKQVGGISCALSSQAISVNNFTIGVSNSLSC